MVCTDAGNRGVILGGGVEPGAEICSRDAQSVADAIEEQQAELGAGPGEAEHDVSGVTSSFADGAARDLSLDDDGSDVAGVGVERDFGPLRRERPFFLATAQTLEEIVERGAAGHSLEDAVEQRGQIGGLLGRGRELAILPAPIEPPSHAPRGFAGVQRRRFRSQVIWS
jgi:hypothetical protein